MAACRVQSVSEACKFRPQFAQLELADQLAMIANCVEVVASVMHECDEKQKRLADWIDAP